MKSCCPNNLKVLVMWAVKRQAGGALQGTGHGEIKEQKCCVKKAKKGS